MHLVLLLLPLLLHVPHAVRATPPIPTAAADKAALLAIKHALPPADFSSNWDAATDPCATPWRFISCTRGDGTPDAPPRVTTLYLDSQGFTGTVPHAVTQLTALEVFDVMFNDFSPLPAWLAEIPTLRVFEADGNTHMGDDAVDPLAVLRGNSALERLSLPRCGLVGTLPAWAADAWPKLNNLILDENKLHGPIPDTYGALEELDWLHLSRNALSGVLPAWLGNHTFASLRLYAATDEPGHAPERNHFLCPLPPCPDGTCGGVGTHCDTCTLDCHQPHGECIHNAAGEQACACAPGWDPTGGCTACATAVYGPACDKLCPGGSGEQVCGGLGTCREGVAGDGECVCVVGAVPNAAQHGECVEALPFSTWAAEQDALRLAPGELQVYRVRADAQGGVLVHVVSAHEEMASAVASLDTLEVLARDDYAPMERSAATWTGTTCAGGSRTSPCVLLRVSNAHADAAVYVTLRSLGESPLWVRGVQGGEWDAGRGGGVSSQAVATMIAVGAMCVVIVLIVARRYRNTRRVRITTHAEEHASMLRP